MKRFQPPRLQAVPPVAAPASITPTRPEARRRASAIRFNITSTGRWDKFRLVGGRNDECNQILALPGTFIVKSKARCATHTAIESAWSTGLSVTIAFYEWVAIPTTLSGPTSVTTVTHYTYTTGGSSSSLGHPIQYMFDWGDGTNSGWLPVGTTSASKSWQSAG